MSITMLVCDLNKIFKKKLLFSLESSKFCVLSLFFSQNLWWWVAVEWIIRSTHTTWSVHNKNKNGGWLKRKYANKARTWNHCHFFVYLTLYHTIALHSLSLPHWLVCECACVRMFHKRLSLSLCQSPCSQFFDLALLFTCTHSYMHMLPKLSGVCMYAIMIYRFWFHSLFRLYFLKNVDIVWNCKVFGLRFLVLNYNNVMEWIDWRK